MLWMIGIGFVPSCSRVLGYQQAVTLRMGAAALGEDMRGT